MLRSTVRVLGRHDVDEALALCSRDLVANLFVASRLRASRQRGAGGEFWGWYDGGELRSLCWSGANLWPVEATAEAIEEFADRARRQGRQCSSIVGPADAVLELWDQVRGSWGPARDVRPEQPLMVIDSPPLVAPDPRVRQTTPQDLPVVTPACVAMFTEEVGYSPVTADGGALYNAQVAGLISAGRSLARIENGPRGPEVIFKAELGSVIPEGAQVQGVWVNPQYRGRGLAAPGMAAVVRFVRARFAPSVSLYVNSYNVRAIRTYERVGFRRAGTFATVLF
ncbi:MAG: GNAT family N-acetyltransferase [Kineosporiaceae bacterium]